jgi:glycine/D-amino acid oxidase-like deaminating enzyme
MINAAEITSTREINVDVLIVGGGVQGLWLLRDFTRVGYHSILIEKEKVGGTQTLHSHGYLHQGYSYNDVGMARHLKSAKDRWTTFCNNQDIPTAHLSSFFGFASPANAELWSEVWEEAGLQQTAETLPEFLQSGLLRRVFRTGDIWLDTSDLARRLVEGVEDRIFHGSITSLKYDNLTRKIQVAIVQIGNESRHIIPQVVVFAAGAGNSGLISMLRDLRIEPNRARYRKSQMLVIKSRHGLLQGHAAIVVPDLSLFIVSRDMRNGDVIWLASYDIDDESKVKFSQLHKNVKEKNGHREVVDDKRVRDTVFVLSAIFPQLFTKENKEQMEWGAYVGLKAEAITGTVILPNEWVIDSFNTSNVYAVWPTKLTLAPQASEKLAFKLLDTIKPTQGTFDASAHGLPSRNWEIGEEKWKEEKLVSWTDFSSQYVIPNM